MNKKNLLEEILDFIQHDTIKIYGKIGKQIIKYLKPAGEEDEYTLDWINSSKIDGQEIAENSKAKVIIATKTVKYSTILSEKNKVLIIVENPKLVIAHVGNHYFFKKPKIGIDISAIINSNATIGSNVYIGANCTIGNCEIGDNSLIYPNVTIFDQVKIGQNVIIQSGARIGTNGLGCQRLENGELYEFPQLGGVIIKSNVYIGSNCHITCGALSNTIIGNGCKINGLSFIGGNCVLGDNVWITGSTMLAGSVTIGNNTTIFSKVVIRDKKTIGENVTIAMGSVVTKDIPDNELWAGVPAKQMVRK